MDLQSHQAGIEIWSAWFVCLQKKNLQSHQAGIEIALILLIVSAAFFLQSHQAGIEICVGVVTSCLRQPLQSHQAGIEMRPREYSFLSLLTYNRTKLELKSLHVHRSASVRVTYNRTKLELKLQPDTADAGGKKDLQSHQAGIEIFESLVIDDYGITYNRTKLELKCVK